MLNNEHYDLIIIGGGIIGAATFYEYQKVHPNKKALILEKEVKLSMHQTGRNSGVMHSGVYYKPGSEKALNCRKGLELLYEFCKEQQVPYDKCGKLIVANNEKEVNQLQELKKRGELNGIQGLEILDQENAKKHEPYVKCLKALYVPETGIVNYSMVVEKFIELGLNINKESNIKFGQEVISFNKNGYESIIQTRNNTYKANEIIFCTGLQSDRFAKMDGINLNMRVVPFRGDYYILKPEASYKVKNLIYPVSNPDLPFLGVHLTRMMNGSIECGPNAVFSFKREGYKKLSFKFIDSKDSLFFIGTWKLFSRFWKNGIQEYYRAFSKKKFLKSLRELVPSIQLVDLDTHRAGVRAQVVGYDGNLVDDFLIKRGECGIHVINAPSPAATACISIAKNIINTLEKE